MAITARGDQVDEALRRSLYENLRTNFPELFANPPGAPYEILTDDGDVAAAEAVCTAQLASFGMPAFMGETGVVYLDPYGMVVRDAVRLPGGGYGTYRRLIAAGNAPGVVVLPRYGDGVVLVNHFRHSTRDWRLELPRGYGTPGSDPESDARRELREEIGVEAAAMHELGATVPDAGLSGTPVCLYYAEITDPPGPADADEGIDAVRVVPPGELAAMIRDETITDGFTITAYARAVLRGLLPSPAR